MTCHKVYLQLISVRLLRFQNFKYIKVKAHNECHNESTRPRSQRPIKFLAQLVIAMLVGWGEAITKIQKSS